MSIMEHVSKAKRRITERIDSAFTALNDGNPDLAFSHYLSAVEEVGRAKMFRENLGEGIADAPSDSIIRMDNTQITARDARFRVGLHYLEEHSMKPPFSLQEGSVASAKRDGTDSELKSAIVGLKSLSAFL